MTIARKYSDLITVYWKPLLLCIGLAFFSQALGTSAFLYYGAEIFLETGADPAGETDHEHGADTLDNITIVTFVFGSFISIGTASMIPTVGRRNVLLVALPIVLAAQCGLAYTMYMSNYGDSEDNNNGDHADQDEFKEMERFLFIIFLVVFMFTVATGLAPAVWGLASDVTPPYLLTTACAICGCIAWLTNFALNSVFLDAIDDPNGRWFVFLILAGITAGAYAYARWVLPDTAALSTRECLIDIIGKEKYFEEMAKLYEESGLKYSDVVDDDVRDALD